MSAPNVTTATARAILDATLLVIGEKGVRGTTTRAIAQRASVHEVTLFRNFGTKNSLIKAAIATRFATVETESVRYTGDVVTDLVRLARAYHEALEAFGAAARALLAEVPFDPELAGSREGPAQLFAAVAGMLGRYQREGLLQPEPADVIIPAFLGPIAMPHITGGPPDGGPRAAFDPERHVDRFLHGRAGVDR